MTKMRAQKEGTRTALLEAADSGERFKQWMPYQDDISEESWQ